MQAFHNDIKIKDQYMARVMAHFDADELIKGTYWKDGKGCAVGCTIHSGDHALYEVELGIPEWLARLEDRIFEGLPNGKAKEWPVKFLAAIHVGADLDKIKSPFLIFVLESTLDKFDHAKSPEVKKAIDDVISLHKQENVTESAWAAARFAAWSAAGAARSAARSAAWSAAGAAAYIKFADKLLELLGNCK